MLALYEVVKNLCLEIGIYMMIAPRGLSDDRNFRPLQNAHNMETVYPITKEQGPYNAANMNLMKNEQCIYENSAH